MGTSVATFRIRQSHSVSAGFTLIEVLAGVFLTAMVMGALLSFQLNLGNATHSARGRIRAQRHAVAILDRVGRDIQGAYLLVKAEEVDPMDHPWLFLAEKHSAQLIGAEAFDDGNDEDDGDAGSAAEAEGANAVKFITRNHRPSSDGGPSSDLANVAYFLNKQEDRPGYQLMRWLDPTLPETLDRSFPLPEDDRSLIVAEDIAHFGMTFLDEEGGETESWDSSQIEMTGALPLAVRMKIQMLDPDTGEEIEGNSDEEGNPFQFSRMVILHMRPVDFKILAEDAIEAEEAFASQFPVLPGQESDDDAKDGCTQTLQQCADHLIASADGDQKAIDFINEQLDENGGEKCVEDMQDFNPHIYDACTNY